MACSSRRAAHHFGEIESEGPSHSQERRGLPRVLSESRWEGRARAAAAPKPTFVIVAKFRDPEIEAAYQAAALNIKISVDDAWILYGTIVDLLLFWKVVPTSRPMLCLVRVSYLMPMFVLSVLPTS